MHVYQQDRHRTGTDNHKTDTDELQVSTDSYKTNTNKYNSLEDSDENRSLFHKSVKLGTLVQFGALNIFRYGAIAKTPPGGHGRHLNFRHYQLMYFAS